MKKPEMEIVKFHNEDVIATSLWSGRVSAFPSTALLPCPSDISNNEVFCAIDSDVNVWMNSELWKYNYQGTDSPYNNSNTLDGKSIDSLDYAIEMGDADGPVFMHYNLNSFVGAWNDSNSNKVYSVWKTCFGEDDCDGSCHPFN